MELHKNNKLQPTNFLCSKCDLFLGYHKRTNRFYCTGCNFRMEITVLDAWTEPAWDMAISKVGKKSKLTLRNK